jgi:hypothetical protein
MANIFRRTRRALAVAERYTEERPGTGLAAVQRERGERAWRFLREITNANADRVPRFVTTGFLTSLFKVTPYAARVALEVIRRQPKGQPWPNFAELMDREQLQDRDQ